MSPGHSVCFLPEAPVGNAHGRSTQSEDPGAGRNPENQPHPADTHTELPAPWSPSWSKPALWADSAWIPTGSQDHPTVHGPETTEGTLLNRELQEPSLTQSSACYPTFSET